MLAAQSAGHASRRTARNSLDVANAAPGGSRRSCRSPARCLRRPAAGRSGAALHRAEIRVLNKGVGGEREAEMIRRFDRDVLAEHPDLVIWQVGANAVIDDDKLRPDERLIRSGIERLQAAGI